MRSLRLCDYLFKHMSWGFDDGCSSQLAFPGFQTLMFLLAFTSGFGGSMLNYDL